MSEDEDRGQDHAEEIEKGSRPHSPPVAPTPQPDNESDGNEKPQ